MSIKNQIIWLTGASSGIGEALVYELNRRGASLIISSRNTQELERVKQNVPSKDSAVYILPLDISDIKSAETAAQAVIEKYGRIDVLINNAGVSQRSLAKDTPVAVDEKLMHINYLGTVALTKSVLPYMIKQKSGNITTVTSAVGKFGSPWRSGYAASKHALHGFFDSLRAEVYEYGIKILLVCPGFVNTNVSKNALNEKGEALQQMDKATAEGLSAEFVAKKIADAIEQNKQEIIIGRFKENLGVWMKRFFPSIFSLMVRKMAVR
jgi:short-subunit dehydrogenase